MNNSIIMASSEQQKDVFLEALHDLVGINFSNCGILINLRVTWSSQVMFLTSAKRRLSDLRQPRAAADIRCNLVDINFEGMRNICPLGLPGHLRRCFDIGNVPF